MGLQPITMMYMLTDNLVFTGCSMTRGAGLDYTSDDPGLWCNILHQSHPLLQYLAIVNNAQDGLSNQEIFNRSVEALIKYRPKFMFVGWSESHRINVNPGLEAYKTSIMLSANSNIAYDIELNQCTYSIDYIKNIKNRFFDLQNLHYLFVNLLDQCRILSKVAEYVGTKIFFINTLSEWDHNYFCYNQFDNRTPSQLTPFTQQLINVNHRDDSEIFKIYDNMHADYNNVNGLDNWLNLYQGYRSNFYLDKGNDSIHPGYLSNQKFAEFLLAAFKQ